MGWMVAQEQLVKMEQALIISVGFWKLSPQTKICLGLCISKENHSLPTGEESAGETWPKNKEQDQTQGEEKKHR